MGNSHRQRPEANSLRFLIGAAVLLLTTLQWVVAHADEGRSAVVGEIWYTDPSPIVAYQSAFRAGLRELGYVEGQNLTIVARYANGDATRLPKLAAELV